MDNIIDLLKKCRRGPQIITPKDAGVIITETGLNSGKRCLDAGGGSGFLTLMLANVVAPKGRVYSYEKNPNFAEIVKHNVKLCGLEKIVTVKNRDAEEFSEKNLDLITLDMKGAENLIGKCHKALKNKGFLCVYSPHIEQQNAASKRMKKEGFSQIKTVENIQREWLVGTHTHPIPSGVMHTGFLTFGRKI
ncbi:MAG: methyltransferase domain-containing protein [Candidatus Aenigmarchaeota archaeon]|nr:methyltransferase domain-containing protein [Candidatus Aenigmarchaeota archaeon]